MTKHRDLYFKLFVRFQTEFCTIWITLSYAFERVFHMTQIFSQTGLIFLHS